MATIMKIGRADVGKNTGIYHHANEARLLNWVAFGRSEGLDLGVATPQLGLAGISGGSQRDSVVARRYVQRAQANPLGACGRSIGRGRE